MGGQGQSWLVQERLGRWGKWAMGWLVDGP